MKLNELFEAKYKQWKRGVVVLDRNGKVHIVDKQEDVKVFMKGHSNGHFHPNGLTEVADDIVDAVKSLGTLDELPAIYDRVLDLMHKPSKGQNLISMDDGDLLAMISKAKGQEKFALRVALKVLGRREPKGSVHNEGQKMKIRELLEVTGDKAFDKAMGDTISNKSALDKKERAKERQRIAKDKKPMNPDTLRSRRIESMLAGLGLKRIREEYMAELDNESQWHLGDGLRLRIDNHGRRALVEFDGPSPDGARFNDAEKTKIEVGSGWWQTPSRNPSVFSVRHTGLRKLASKDKFDLRDVEDLDAFDAWVETWVDAIRRDRD